MDINTFAAVDNHDIEVYVGITADWSTRNITIDVEQFIADRATYVAALDYSLTNGYNANPDEANLYASADDYYVADEYNSYAGGDYDYWFDNQYGEDLDRLDKANGFLKALACNGLRCNNCHWGRHAVPSRLEPKSLKLPNRS
eukprot:scaffold47794_cov49-Prasinocladus_malaysianus.AAC.1